MTGSLVHVLVHQLPKYELWLVCWECEHSTHAHAVYSACRQQQQDIALVELFVLSLYQQCKRYAFRMDCLYPAAVRTLWAEVHRHE